MDPTDSGVYQSENGGQGNFPSQAPCPKSQNYPPTIAASSYWGTNTYPYSYCRWSGRPDYQSKEQWKADYVFLKLQLKQAKAKVVVNIFDTDTISKPSNFLRRFWAATGVPKTKPITDVVADILNSKNG